MILKVAEMILLTVLFFTADGFAADTSVCNIFRPGQTACLSVPLLSGNLAETSIRDISQIRLLFKAHLRLIFERGNWGIYRDSIGNAYLQGKTSSSPRLFQFFFSEKKILINGYSSVMCRVWDVPGDLPRTYYVIFDSSGTNLEDMEISVLSGREYEERISGKKSYFPWGKTIFPRKTDNDFGDSLSGAINCDKENRRSDPTPGLLKVDRKAAVEKGPHNEANKQLREHIVDIPLVKISGHSSESKKNIRQLMREAWKSAGMGITKPFSQEAQEVFLRINELERSRREQGLSLSAQEYFMVFYSQVFGENRYDGIIDFMEWVAKNRKGDLKDFSESVLKNTIFWELYFTARLLDGTGPVLSWIARRPFVDFYADQLLGEHQGHRFLRSLYGGSWDEHYDKIGKVIFEDAIAFAFKHEADGEAEKALSVIKTLVNLSITERKLAMFERCSSEEESVFLQELCDFMLDEHGVLSENPSVREEAVRRAIASGYYERSISALRVKARSSVEKKLLGFADEILKKLPSDENFPKEVASQDLEKLSEQALMAGLKIPTHPEVRYRLLVTPEFFSGQELMRHRRIYGDRFEIKSVSALDNDSFVEKVIRMADGRAHSTVALVPDTLTLSQVDRIISSGIRVLRVDINSLLDLRLRDQVTRNDFQVGVYATMLLARKIDNNTLTDSPEYRMLRLYLDMFFLFRDGLNSEVYIKALAADTSSTLFEGVLLYRDMERLSVPYHRILSTVLISA